MSVYQVKTDDKLWADVKERADSEGLKLKWIIAALLRYYVSNGMPKGTV